MYEIARGWYRYQGVFRSGRGEGLGGSKDQEHFCGFVSYTCIVRRWSCVLVGYVRRRTVTAIFVMCCWRISDAMVGHGGSLIAGCGGLGHADRKDQPVPKQIATLANKKIIQVRCGGELQTVAYCRFLAVFDHECTGCCWWLSLSCLD